MKDYDEDQRLEKEKKEQEQIDKANARRHQKRVKDYSYWKANQ
jgi:hypothetical protein